MHLNLYQIKQNDNKSKKNANYTISPFSTVSATDDAHGTECIEWHQCFSTNDKKQKVMMYQHKLSVGGNIKRIYLKNNCHISVFSRILT